MITLFRRIREKLIASGSVTKYLLYALGEILLVVIGILIAVQVNTMIQNSADEERRRVLVNGLSSEFDSNLAQLDTVVASHELALESGNALMIEIAKRAVQINQKRIDSLLSDNGWGWTYDPLNGVLNTAISSGNIHLIKNDALKELLFSWKDVVEDAREEQIRALTHYHDVMMPYLEENGSISNTIFSYRDRIPETSFSHDYRKMIFDPKFENLISNRSVYTIDVLNELEVLHALNSEILHLLETEY